MNMRSPWLVDTRSTKQLRPPGYRPYEITSFCLVDAPKTKQNQATKLQEICLVDLLGRCLSLEKAKPSYQANLDQRSGIGGSGTRIFLTHTFQKACFSGSADPNLRLRVAQNRMKIQGGKIPPGGAKPHTNPNFSPDAKWDFLVTKPNLS